MRTDALSRAAMVVRHAWSTTRYGWPCRSSWKLRSETIAAHSERRMARQWTGKHPTRLPRASRSEFRQAASLLGVLRLHVRVWVPNACERSRAKRCSSSGAPCCVSGGEKPALRWHTTRAIGVQLRVPSISPFCSAARYPSAESELPNASNLRIRAVHRDTCGLAGRDEFRGDSERLFAHGQPRGTDDRCAALAGRSGGTCDWGTSQRQPTPVARHPPGQRRPTGRLCRR